MPSHERPTSPTGPASPTNHESQRGTNHRDAPAHAPGNGAQDQPPVEGVIVAGFGIIGRAAADAARLNKLPVTVVETNPNTITTQRDLGLRVVEGDITDAAILEQAGIATASMLVLAIPDDDAVLRCCRIARERRPDLCIIARSRYMSLGMKAEAAGATRAVVEELATAIEMGKLVANQLGKRDA